MNSALGVTTDTLFLNHASRNYCYRAMTDAEKLFLLGATEGYHSVCKALLESDEAEISSEARSKAFHLAVANGHLLVCQCLRPELPLDAHAGADYFSALSELKNKCERVLGRSLLRTAACCNRLEICQWIHDTLGVTAEDVRADNNFVLRIAIHSGHLEICQWIHETYALTANDVRLANNIALITAAHKGRLDVCKWLYETYALKAEDVRDCNSFALHIAARKGHLGVCKWLCETFGLTANDARRQQLRVQMGRHKGPPRRVPMALRDVRADGRRRARQQQLRVQMGRHEGSPRRVPVALRDVPDTADRLAVHVARDTRCCCLDDANDLRPLNGLDALFEYLAP